MTQHYAGPSAAPLRSLIRPTLCEDLGVLQLSGSINELPLIPPATLENKSFMEIVGEIGLTAQSAFIS